MAVGIALLKARSDGATEVFSRLLEDLRKLHQAVSHGRQSSDRSDPATSLRDEARRIGIVLDLKVVGSSRWLSAAELDLLRLAGREALRNVKRHAGSEQCRVTMDLSDCPFVMRVRDWGAGLPVDAQAGEGIRLLRNLAEESGCGLSIGSQPGLGTELVLVGRRCPRTTESPAASACSERRLASDAGDVTSRSRSGVAGRRSIRASKQEVGER